MKYGKGNPLLKKKGRKTADNPMEERQEKKTGFVPFRKKKK